MHSNAKCLLFVIVLSSLGISVASAQSNPASPPPPTIDQLQHALDTVKPGGLPIGEFLGCLPVSRQPENVRLCVLSAQGDDPGEFQEIPFRFSKGRWAVLLDKKGRPPKLDAACASPAIAQAAFRRLQRDEGLRVVGQHDGGDGVFTDQRGISRNRKGAYRLMCLYEVVKSSGAKNNTIAYVWSDGATYTIDPDIEVWPGD